MTREEAIERIKEIKDRAWGYHIDKEVIGIPYSEFLEIMDSALSALRHVSREKVEKVWRGCPECKHRCGLCVHIGQWDKYGKPYTCESCVDFSNFESEQQFCEVCGSPMTDKAVHIVMERLEALHEDSC